MIDEIQAEDVEFEIEIENWDTVQVFMRMQTQWRHSFGGISGLDFGIFDRLCRLQKVKDADEVFDGIQIMEVSALKAMNDGR